MAYLRPGLMRHTSQSVYRLKLPAKLVIFGLWGATFSLVVLYFSVRMLAAVSTFDAGVLGSDGGLNLNMMIMESILLVYRGGLLSLGIGGVFMALGGTILMSPNR